MADITYHEDTDRFIITTSQRNTYLMKQIPGTRFLQKHQAWVIDANLALIEGVQAAVDCTFDDIADAKVSMLELQAQAAIDQKDRRHPLKRVPELYPFQAAGVRFLGKAKQAALVDDMGLGKTVQALAVLDIEKAWPALIVCPNSVKYNWAEEIMKWTDATPYVVGGTPAVKRKTFEQFAEDKGHKALIINYEALRLHTKLASFGNRVLSEKEAEPKELNEHEWAAVVADEVHKAKDPGSGSKSGSKGLQTRALWGVSKGVPIRFGLTGTPIVNNPDDLWSIMHFVSPEEWPSRSRFRDRYCITQPGWFGGIENKGIDPAYLPELDRFLQPRFLRRTKAEELTELPTKTLVDLVVPMEGKQQTAYNQMVKHMIAEVDGGILDATDPLTLVGRARAIASAMPVLNDDGDIVELGTPSNKLNAVLDILDGSDEQLVVFAQSRKLIELFERELEKHYRLGLITGTKSAKERQAAVSLFQQGDLDVILATTGAGAEGITLTAASHLVMAQEDWSNVVNLQAHDRIYRIGQENPVTITTLRSAGTVDISRVQVAAETKNVRAQELLRDPENFKAMLQGAL